MKNIIAATIIAVGMVVGATIVANDDEPSYLPAQVPVTTDAPSQTCPDGWVWAGEFGGYDLGCRQP